MITPRFHIEQTEMDVIFTIHAPYASIADAEVYADLDIFCFYASPYYLRLHLPGFIEETDASKGSYDADKGTFVLCVQKITRGEHFGGLDFVTALLTPRNNSKRKEVKPVIEVVGNHIENSSSEEEYSDEEDWYIDQCPFEEPSDDFLLTAPHYGFANKVSGAFQNFKTEFLEIIELSDPDKTPASSRSKLRASHESENFSDDHYLADWLQTEMIEPLLTFKAQWESDSSVPFLDEEIDTLKDFPKKEFLLNKREERFAFLSLIDILFAYAYNSRSTMEENTVESAWTVNKLSATLSWFQNFSTVKEAVLVPIRRSLCYPLFRNWELSIKVLDDTKRILHLGKHQILKSLLEIYAMFNNSEPRYLLNQLYIRDYCIWIQHVSDSQIKSLSSNLEKVHLCKADVELDLEELETAAKLVQLEEKMSEKKAVGETDGSFHGLSSEERLCHKISVLSVSEKGMKKNIPRPGRADDSVSSKDSEDDSSSSDEESSSSFSSSSSTSLDSDDLSDTETNKPAEVPRIE